VIDNKELAEYLNKRIKEDGLGNYRSTWCQVPTEEDLEFWIQQFKTRGSVGHSEWNEMYQCNMWIKDN
jgi:hypothetical protein